MSPQTFDAIAALRRLEESGIPRAQAEAMVQCHQETINASRGDLATKADLANLRSETKQGFSDLRSELLKMMLVQMGATIASVMALLTIFEFLRG